MSYEVQRDIEVETLDEAPNGIFCEPAFTIGSPPALRMPEFTDAELAVDLDKDWCQDLERILANAFAKAVQAPNS